MKIFRADLYYFNAQDKFGYSLSEDNISIDDYEEPYVGFNGSIYDSSNRSLESFMVTNITKDKYLMSGDITFLDTPKGTILQQIYLGDNIVFRPNLYMDDYKTFKFYSFSALTKSHDLFVDLTLIKRRIKIENIWKHIK